MPLFLDNYFFCQLLIFSHTRKSLPHKGFSLQFQSPDYIEACFRFFSFRPVIGPMLYHISPDFSFVILHNPHHFHAKNSLYSVYFYVLRFISTKKHINPHSEKSISLKFPDHKKVYKTMSPPPIPAILYISRV